MSTKKIHMVMMMLALGIGQDAVAGYRVVKPEAKPEESFIDRAARTCPDYSRDRATPGLRNMRGKTLQVMARLGYFLCPDRRIKSPMAVIFYADRRVFTWNPESPDSVSALRQITDRLADSEEYPDSLTVWDAQGRELTNQFVPSLQLRRPPSRH